jgi:hypothetical protein
LTPVGSGAPLQLAGDRSLEKLEQLAEQRLRDREDETDIALISTLETGKSSFFSHRDPAMDLQYLTSHISAMELELLIRTPAAMDSVNRSL